MADGKLLVLGLESSCDDTAAAVLRVSTETDTEILSSVVSGQTDLHKDFGGVVPEIAARAHAEMLDLCVEQALDQASVEPKRCRFNWGHVRSWFDRRRVVRCHVSQGNCDGRTKTLGRR